MSTSDPWLTLLADLTFKGTIVLAVTALIAHIARGTSAAARHRIWITGLVALLLIPFSYALLPRLYSPVFPALRSASRSMSPTTGSASRDVLARSSESPTASDSGAVNPLSDLTRTASVSASVAVPEETDDPSPRLPWEVFAIAAWLGGAIIVLTRLAVGTLRVGRQARRAQLFTDTHLLGDVQLLARTHGVTRPVTVLQSDTDCVPVTWGTIYPVLLLPPAAAQWTPERRKIVAMHEIAHIARMDSLTQLIAHMAAAVFWFQPLAWLAVRRSRHEREKACDDFVLANGVAASQYAADLLALSRTLPLASTPGFHAISVAGPSELEARVRAILSVTVTRDPFPKAWSRGATMALCAALPFAMLTSSDTREATRRATPVAPAATQTSTLGDVLESGVGMREYIAARNRRGGLALIVEDVPHLRSDHARREFWLAILALVGPLGRGELGDIAREARAIESDSNRVPVLTRVLEMGGHDVVDAICAASSGMRSTSARAGLLKLAMRADSSSAPPAACFEAAESLRSDEDLVGILRAALGRETASQWLLVSVAQSARFVTSETARAQLLVDAARIPQSLEPRALRSLRATAATIADAGLRSEVLSTLRAR